MASIFDMIREDLRLQLLYIIEDRSYENLVEETKDYTSTHKAVMDMLDSYTDISSMHINKESLWEVYQGIYEPARIATLIMKQVRTIAQSKELSSIYGTNIPGIKEAVTRILVEYYNAHNYNDIIRMCEQPTINRAVSLMVAAFTKAELNNIPTICYSYLYIPEVSQRLVDADFMMHVAKEKTALKHSALSMRASMDIAYSECLYTLLSREYQTFLAECDDSYDNS